MKANYGYFGNYLLMVMVYFKSQLTNQIKTLKFKTKALHFFSLKPPLVKMWSSKEENQILQVFQPNFVGFLQYWYNDSSLIVLPFKEPIPTVFKDFSKNNEVPFWIRCMGSWIKMFKSMFYEVIDVNIIF